MTTPADALTNCQTCGAIGPTCYVDFRYTIGMLVFRSRGWVRGFLCRRCAGKYFRQYTVATAVGGWWGLLSFGATLRILPHNIRTYRGARRRFAAAAGP